MTIKYSNLLINLFISLLKHEFIISVELSCIAAFHLTVEPIALLENCN